MIQFLLNDKLISINGERADITVLTYLREKLALTGTKEGCASGDCGACTVVIASPVVSNEKSSQALQYLAINSCVTFLSALHGKQLVTVEHLSNGTNLHPVQQAMVDHHGSQCGFCTPGFVMSMFALYKRNQMIERSNVIHALSGNLCRCTGYKPIIAAALAACNKPSPDKFNTGANGVAEQLISLQTMAKGTDNLLMPQDREGLALALRKHPSALLVAGSTDLALLHTQQLQPISKMISLTGVHELKRIETDENTLTIGAACTLSEMQSKLLDQFPALQEVIERFASVPIRNQATIGGNIANASPIGDIPPILIALNAFVVLDDGSNYRNMPISDFFIGYKQTQLGKHEWLDSIKIPLAKANSTLRVYKVSKRIEDDISAVCMAVNIVLEDGIIVSLTAGFGGVAATPSTCTKLDDSLVGKQWQKASTLALGKAIISETFSPIDDVRASGAYRQQILENLWHRFWLETNSSMNSIETRVNQHA